LTPRHGRIDMVVQIARITIHEWRHYRGQTSISLSTAALFRAKGEISVQLEIGNRRHRRVEEVNDGRRCILLPLTTDISNESYPPMILVHSQMPISNSELFWLVKLASTSILFRTPSHSALVLYPIHPKMPQFVTLSQSRKEEWGKQSIIKQM
jgi:hypothetical protein